MQIQVSPPEGTVRHAGPPLVPLGPRRSFGLRQTPVELYLLCDMIHYRYLMVLAGVCGGRGGYPGARHHAEHGST